MQLDGNKKLHLSWRFIAQTLLNPTFFALNLFTIKSVMRFNKGAFFIRSQSVESPINSG